MQKSAVGQLAMTLGILLIAGAMWAQTGSFKDVVYVGGAVSAWRESDIGAQINHAYDALPPNGGTIMIVPPNGEGCYDYWTPIMLTVPGKYVRLEGTGSGNSACLNYRPRTGAAITLDYVANKNIPQNTNHGLRNILLVNNSCYTTDGCGSSAIGINTGPTNGGSTYAVFENVSVSGFSVGYRNLNPLSVGQVWNNPGFSNNGVAQQFANIAQVTHGGTFAGNITAFNVIASGGAELVITNTFFFAQ